ncbi:MAG TPA: glycosyltransferase family 4 protein [Balneolaceae bacterium]|nr:glycosyltransferase family 4 protein [Balneolaceae bacterium]
MLRILLFSPKGAGNHYYGPGMNAFRMYQKLRREDQVTLSLAHGYPDQERSDIFYSQHFLSDIVNKNLWLGVKFLQNSKKWIEKNARNYDVVHCLTAFQHSFMFAKWFEEQGVPVLIKIGQSDHTGFNENSLQSRLLGLNRYRLRHANDITGYISISRIIRQKLQDAGIRPEKIHDIPNGVDVDRFRPAESSEKRALREKLNLKDQFTVIFTGAFSDRKNPLLVAQALQNFTSEEQKQIQLLLIGPDTDQGEQRREIQNLIHSRGLSNIIVKDFVRNVEDYYKASDLFVLPSNQEGFSNSMLEAQACGLPAVVTKISGSEDLIVDSLNGTFISATDDSIYQAINVYFKNPEIVKKESAAARRKILDSYSSEVILKKHLELFRNIIAEQ